MSTNQDDMATQPPQSLPSFAQAFSSPSLNRISTSNNALPPIQRHASPRDLVRRSSSGHPSPQPSVASLQSSKKRLHAESSPQGNDEGSEPDGHRSPRTVRIKEEADHDKLLPSSSESRTTQQLQETQDSMSAPSPSEAKPSPSKRRRVTISGISHPINTDVRTTSADNINNISPVVMGFTIMRDDPAALEQVRSMLTVKQKQKELIEQRRGSTASIVSTAPPSVNIVNAPQPSDDRQIPPKTHAPGRSGGRSPNFSSSTADRRRSIAVISSAAPQNHTKPSHTRQQSPSSLIVPREQQPLPPPPPPVPSESASFAHPVSSAVAPHSLPAPPISFARRRASRQLGGAKGKPADIVISPRDPQLDSLQPVIQSAPPIPRAEQGSGPSARFSNMTLPSLPQLGGPLPRQTSGRVPPTPTRLSMPRNVAGSSAHQQANFGGTSGRSPQNASIPIATTLVPPTPAALHHPGYSGEKSAFLAPFEMFYDALSDSKQLKNWLGEQLQKSHALTISLQRQQEQLDEIVNVAVEKRVATMREEVYSLHRRVEELEQALRRTSGTSQTYSPGVANTKSKVKANGVPVVPDTYTFPPVEPNLRRPEPIRRIPSPSELESRSFPGSQTASPVSFDVGRRLSVSAIRLDPRSPAGMAAEALPPPRKSFGAHSQSQGSRDRDHPANAFPAPPGAHSGKATWSPKTSSRGSHHHTDASGLARRQSVQRVSAEQHQYREGKDSPASSDGRPEGHSVHQRRDPAVVSPPRSHARSPIDEE
ncbi:hypothetical protein AcV5_007437 [Taiwanofungus camphoratus]|nr:hypothetical protein AcV7_005813 [Antrodia cinnamomea]KAI0926726.1 hypothetical protein AcV5_007437 [Antrodia cinnamomea]